MGRNLPRYNGAPSYTDNISLIMTYKSPVEIRHSKLRHDSSTAYDRQYQNTCSSKRQQISPYTVCCTTFLAVCPSVF